MSTCTRESHDAIKLDPIRWSQLPCIGRQRVEADETGPAETLELRNCTCGSTLCVEVES